MLSQQNVCFCHFSGNRSLLCSRMFSPGYMGNNQSLVLGVIMFTMGLTLTTEDFKVLAKRPLDIFIGAAAQYLIMPFLAYGISTILRLPNEIAIGLILVGCCPGGVSSNIMSYLCHGDVPFSVGMTTAPRFCHRS